MRGIDKLKERVLQANLLLPEQRLVTFIWGKNPLEAVHNAAVMEEVAFMDWNAMALNPKLGPKPQALLDKHYLRKRGKNACYGQN